MTKKGHTYVADMAYLILPRLTRKIRHDASYVNSIQSNLRLLHKSLIEKSTLAKPGFVFCVYGSNILRETAEIEKRTSRKQCLKGF